LVTSLVITEETSEKGPIKDQGTSIDVDGANLTPAGIEMKRSAEKAQEVATEAPDMLEWSN
jgi:hypothetical protein